MAEDLDDEFDEELEGDEGEVAAHDPYAEINELKQKLSLLQKTKEAQRTRYKKEMHMIVNTLLARHKEVKHENRLLQQQLQQSTGDSSGPDDFMDNLRQSLEEQKKEAMILRKMVAQLEQQNSHQQKATAEADTLRELLREKDLFIRELEEQNQNSLYQLEAKDAILSRTSAQLSNLEAEVYALNKRLRSSGDASSQPLLEENQQLREQVRALEGVRAQYEQQIKAMQAQAKQAVEVASAAVASAEANVEDADYEQAMDMIMQELQDSLSTYDELSSQVSKARS
jgi:chromosome segregation ATPase